MAVVVGRALRDQEVSGGYLNVPAGGRASFFTTAVFMYDAGVTTVSEDSMAHGGCVYNEVGAGREYRAEKNTYVHHLTDDSLHASERSPVDVVLFFPRVPSGSPKTASWCPLYFRLPKRFTNIFGPAYKAAT